MRKWLLAAAAAAIFVAPVAATAQAPIVIKFSHVVAPNTPKGKGADKFKELAEKYTNGKVKVEVYPNSTLYKDKEELEALQLGAVQMLAPSNSQVRPDRRQGIRGVRPAVHPAEHGGAAKVTEGPIGQKLLKLLEPKGMIGLAYWDNGFKHMSANKPLRMPEDYQGLKFRIQSSKVLEAQFRAARRDPAGDGVLGSLSGAADRRGRRPGKHAVEHVHPEIPRGAEVHDAHQPRLYRLCRHREQEVLGRLAGRRSRPAREGDEGSDRLRQQDLRVGERGSAGRDQEVRQDPDHQSDRRRMAAMHKAMEPLYQDMASRVGKELIDEFARRHRRDQLIDGEPGLKPGLACFPGGDFRASIDVRRVPRGGCRR